VVDRSDDASCLLGLAGLAVERVACAPLGVRIVQLVTDDPDAARCPVCRVVSTSGKDWVLTRPHDLPSGGGQIAVQWRKRRWRCRTVDCARATFTEQVAQVPAGMRTTTRLRTALAVAVQDGRDQSEVAAAHGVSWPTVQRAVVVHGAVELGEPEPTPVLGMDETRFGRPRWLPEGVHDGPGEDGRIRWVRTDPWETGFVDIAGDQALLGQVDGRTSAAVQAWLAARTPEFRAGVEVVVIDPHAGYAAAVRAALPDAVIAVELGRTRARCPGCPGSVSRVRPPNRTCVSPRIRLSTCLSRCSAAGGGGGPGGRYVRSAVAVAGHGDAGGAGEHDPVLGDSPALVTEPAA
jgi:hypothetical protein